MQHYPLQHYLRVACVKTEVVQSLLYLYFRFRNPYVIQNTPVPFRAVELRVKGRGHSLQDLYFSLVDGKLTAHVPAFPAGISGRQAELRHIIPLFPNREIIPQTGQGLAPNPALRHRESFHRISHAPQTFYHPEPLALHILFPGKM